MQQDEGEREIFVLFAKLAVSKHAFSELYIFVLVTRDRKTDFQSRQTSRTVFQCHVIGPKGVGKVSINRKNYEMMPLNLTTCIYTLMC